MVRNFAITAMLACCATPALASELESVTAASPEGMVAVLDMTGYEPKLDSDAVGDPLIRIEIAGRPADIFFYGCDEATNDGCDSVQLSVGFDRAEPWNAEAALEVSKTYRFASVFLDEEMDPFVRWDIFTGDGIPTKVFLAALLRFTQTVEEVEDLVFAEE